MWIADKSSVRVQVPGTCTWQQKSPPLREEMIGCQERNCLLKAHGLHIKQAPPHHSTLKRASILILLSNDGDILLTQRGHHLRSHPGEVCFPGGKQDEDDDGDDWQTALRETSEEVGLNIQPERLARLRTLESLNHLCVTPLVAFWDKPSLSISSQIQINPTEVEQFFWVPLQFFIITPPVQEYDIPWQNEIFIFRKYLFGPSQIPITGLTAHVAREVAVLAYGSTPVNDTTIPTTIMNTPYQGYQGLLWKRQDPTHGTTPTWCSKYFILSHGMLHQYDTQQMAERKSQSASKKNRLRLDDDSSINIQDMEKNCDDDRYGFSISILDGRIVWYLAASSSQERSQWKQWLLESSKTNSKSQS